MKRLILISVIAAAPPVAAGGWAPDPEHITRVHMKAYEGMPPEKVARFLAHHNSFPYGAAVQTLAQRGESVLPLLKKLLGDTNPWIRGGAVATLGEMYKVDDPKAPARQATPELEAALALMGKLAADNHPAVQAAMGAFIENTRLETPGTRKIILTMARSPDASVRSKVVMMGRGWLKDPETIVKIGMLVSAAPEGNTPGIWSKAHLLIHKYKDQPLSRPAIPIMARYIRNKANTVPYRGFFSDGAQNRPLDVMLAHWDAEIEKLPDVVPAICRAYVRVPYKDYPGWVKTRDFAKELLDKLTPVSAPAIRATVAEEKKWIAEVSDQMLTTVTEGKPPEARVKVAEFIGHLEQLAEKLEKQK